MIEHLLIAHLKAYLQILITSSGLYIVFIKFGTYKLIKGLDTKTSVVFGKIFDEYMLYDSYNGYELDSCT